MKKRKSIVAIILVLAVLVGFFAFCNDSETIELKSVKSAKELKEIYEGENISEAKELALRVLTMPFSFFTFDYYGYDYGYSNGVIESDMVLDSFTSSSSSSSSIAGSLQATTSSSTGNSSSSKDYSTTNIQVENVDEADITKTDGNYIYSISEDKVIITNVMDPENITKAATISLTDSAIPEDIILYNDKLVVIGASQSSTTYYYSRFGNTIVNIYDITNRENPILAKKYTLYEPYYTSRCIDNKLYVISSGTLREENDEIIAYYSEDNEQKDIGYDNIKYLDKLKTKKQTIISMVDLNNPTKNVNVSSYLMDISNAYVSENSIYLLNQKYEGYNYDVPPISSLFGVWGAIGPFRYEEESEDSGYYTEIYKFDILEDGTVEYSCNTKVKGKTINQYSVDEYNDILRVALYDNNDGSRVVTFDKNLNKLGETSYLAKGERMYSSRFVGDKAYLVTYKTVDPLFVIDLSDANNPKLLGELKIPGYSTYLHPYDENHLIGIGMETQEVINRNSYGQVTSVTSKIVGMKMALFDVSDVNNPIQISSTVIGDRRTTSAILTNPKALLFSKEKQLIAIPVNNYAEDFEVSESSTYSSTISSYTNYSKEYISEGYLVYKINTEEGFSLKGVITHDVTKNSNYYYYTTKLLRGMYIDNNLFTVSEGAVKVNDLETLDLISELKLK